MAKEPKWNQEMKLTGFKQLLEGLDISLNLYKELLMEKRAMLLAAKNKLKGRHGRP